MELVREHGVTVVAGVPAMYHAFLDLDETAAPGDAFAVGAARDLRRGAAATEVSRGDRRPVRRSTIHDGYGLTEASPIVTTSAIGATLRARHRSGRPLPGVDVRLVDADGPDVLPGDPGEIWVRGPNVFLGYWDDDEATRRALTADGWLRTGDVAVEDDAGALHLVDRAKDLIIVSGFNVYPAEVEERPARAIPGSPTPPWSGSPSPAPASGSSPSSWPSPGTTLRPELLTEHASRFLARYKCPSPASRSSASCPARSRARSSAGSCGPERSLRRTAQRLHAGDPKEPI